MNSHSVLNRTLLTIAGLVLLGGGLLVLTGGLDLYRRWGLAPPAGWPLTSPHDTLLPAHDRTRWTGEDWWWPTVIAALAILIALALWWLLAQLRHRHPGRLPVATRPWTVWDSTTAPSATPWPQTPPGSPASTRLAPA